VIVTNKLTGAGKVARFHEGRGYQEKIYGELKNQAQMVRRAHFDKFGLN
jgi:hypothetical protein